MGLMLNPFDPPDVPVCPREREYLLTPWRHLTIEVLMLSITLVALALVSMVWCQYSRIHIFNLSVSPNTVNNTNWIAYFLAVAFRCGVGVAEFAVGSTVGSWMGFAPQPLDGRRDKPNYGTGGTYAAPIAVSAPLGKWQQVGLWLLQLAKDCASVWLMLKADRTWPTTALIVSMVAQRLANLTMGWMASCGRRCGLPLAIGEVSAVRMWKLSRMYMALACTAMLGDLLPPSLWAWWLPDGCWGTWSAVDGMQLGLLASLLLLFCHVRTVFLANVEDCVWDIVGDIQEPYNYRRQILS